jgi:hypothetical protein
MAHAQPDCSRPGGRRSPARRSRPLSGSAPPPPWWPTMVARWQRLRRCFCCACQAPPQPPTPPHTRTYEHARQQLVEAPQRCLPGHVRPREVGGGERRHQQRDQQRHGKELGQRGGACGGAAGRQGRAGGLGMPAEDGRGAAASCCCCCCSAAAEPAAEPAGHMAGPPQHSSSSAGWLFSLVASTHIKSIARPTPACWQLKGPGAAGQASGESSSAARRWPCPPPFPFLLPPASPSEMPASSLSGSRMK